MAFEQYGGYAKLGYEIADHWITVSSPGTKCWGCRGTRVHNFLEVIV